MQDDKQNLTEILRFQQSLMRLVSRGGLITDSDNAPAPTKGPASEQAQQLEVWVRRVRPQAS